MRVTVRLAAVLVMALLPGRLCGAAVEAAVREVRIPPSASLPAGCSAEGTVTAVREDDVPDVRNQRLRWPVDLRRGAVLALPAGSATWRLDFQAPGCWSAPRRIEPAADGELRIDPMGVASLELRPRVTSQGSEPALRVRFRLTPERRAAASDPFEHEAVCRATASGVSCGVPAARLDLKLERPGFAPVYRWRQEVSPGKAIDLGEVVLRPGGSVAGWIDVGGEVSAKYEGQLLPAVRSGVDTRFLAARRSLATGVTVATEGFFQAVGVPPGSYTLRLSSSGGGTAELADIRIQEGQEVVVASPVRLALPVGVEVRITPPVSPSGAEWKVTLVRMLADDASLVERVTEVMAGADGGADLGGLAVGSYAARIADGDARWGEAQFAIGPGDRERIVFIDLEHVWVVGEVHRGDEAVRAAVEFGPAALQSAMLETDADGRFEGLLPRPGRWEVEVRPRLGAESSTRLRITDVEVVPDERGTARVILLLPDTEIWGQVTTAEGQAVSQARVRIRRNDGQGGRILGAMLSGGSGTFGLQGLPAGDVVVEADAFDGAVGSALATLREGSREGPVNVVVDSRDTLTGVVALRGIPFAGASVTAWSRSRAFVRAERAGTDETGRFEIPGSPGVIDLLVVAPGVAVKIARTSFESEERSPVAVELGASVGTLRIQLDPGAADLDPEAAQRLAAGIAGAYVEHNAAAVPFGALLQQAAPEADDTALLFRLMETGPYALCLGPGRCVSAYLGSDGEATLQVAALIEH